MASRAIENLQRALTREAKKAERELTAALEALAIEHAKRFTGPGRTGEPLQRVARALSRISAAADLSGRLGLRFGVPGAEPDQFAAEWDVVPAVAFDEAIQDLAERDPLGAAELRRAGLEVEDAYGAEVGADGVPHYRHAFAAAQAINAEVAAKVKQRLLNGLVAGVPTGRVAENLMWDLGWTRAYAENVVRTTYNTATTAGRFREAARVEGSGIPVSFVFQAVLDSNTRPGHAAMDGVHALATDPIWRSWSPPLGSNCRCTLSPRIGEDAPVGVVPAGAAKQAGYGGRPDLSAYR